jgi:hypothetical protein
LKQEKIFDLRTNASAFFGMREGVTLKISERLKL